MIQPEITAVKLVFSTLKQTTAHAYSDTELELAWDCVRPPAGFHRDARPAAPPGPKLGDDNTCVLQRALALGWAAQWDPLGEL